MWIKPGLPHAEVGYQLPLGFPTRIVVFVSMVQRKSPPGVWRTLLGGSKTMAVPGYEDWGEGESSIVLVEFKQMMRSIFKVASDCGLLI